MHQRIAIGGFRCALPILQGLRQFTFALAFFAAGFAAGGFVFDAGPYILLDKPGLEWALRRLGIGLGALPLTPIESVYEVLHDDGAATGFQHSLAATAAGFEARHPGSGARYAAFVAQTAAVHRRLQPLTYCSRPGLLDVLRQGALGSVPFLRPLAKADQILFESLDRVAERPRTVVILRAIARRIIAGRMGTRAVGDELNQRRNLSRAVVAGRS